MKILITYHSDTGNTEAVAKSMAEGLAGEDVTLLSAKEVDPASLNSYDLIFLGSGTYGGALGKSVKKLIKAAPDLSSKFVLFCTHASPDPAPYTKAFKKLQKKITECECEICAQFQCIGELKNPQVVDVLLKTDPTSKEWLDAAKGHPDANDLENAKKFASSLLQKIEI
ncbi:MAG: flavodoxin domain-containing protein [Candidatus Helarchaeota archaeon]|nr:flavodoxin domain-containing protein [Candidatus Helarchaeota archaeon]